MLHKNDSAAFAPLRTLRETLEEVSQKIKKLNNVQRKLHIRPCGIFSSGP